MNDASLLNMSSSESSECNRPKASFPSAALDKMKSAWVARCQRSVHWPPERGPWCSDINQLRTLVAPELRIER